MGWSLRANILTWASGWIKLWLMYKLPRRTVRSTIEAQLNISLEGPRAPRRDFGGCVLRTARTPSADYRLLEVIKTTSCFLSINTASSSFIAFNRLTRPLVRSLIHLAQSSKRNQSAFEGRDEALLLPNSFHTDTPRCYIVARSSFLPFCWHCFSRNKLPPTPPPRRRSYSNRYVIRSIETGYKDRKVLMSIIKHTGPCSTSRRSRRDVERHHHAKRSGGRRLDTLLDFNGSALDP